MSARHSRSGWPDRTWATCLRFRKPENIGFDLVRDLLGATAARPGTVC
jgi:hypothetical protein